MTDAFGPISTLQVRQLVVTHVNAKSGHCTRQPNLKAGELLLVSPLFPIQATSDQAGHILFRPHLIRPLLS